MNKRILNSVGILLCLASSSCVGKKIYLQKLAELDELKSESSALKKELRQLEKEKSLLLGEIKNWHTKHPEFALNKKPNTQNNILLHSGRSLPFTAAELGRIQYSDPNDTAQYYINWLKENKNTDTNSAKTTTYLSSNEKKIYYYLNFARLNPKKFCSLYILPIYQRDTSDIYVKTLVRYLNKMKPRPALKPDKALYESARCHAVSSGIDGYVGHERIDEKCKPNFRGECCEYGNSSPLNVILDLLIDRGIESLGHRYICLGLYTHVGIATAPHKNYGANTVLDFH